jgi:hypothetical protein
MLARISLASLLCALLLIAGCFETPFSLGSEADSNVDPALCGDWEVASSETDAKGRAKMFIRNLDGKQYFIEWINPQEENQKPEDVETLRMIAFTAQVGEASFAHCRNLPQDGTIPDKHLVIRYAIDNGQIVLRNLREEFFRDQTLTSDADFRRLVEENIDNPEMYQDSEMRATRVGK